MWREWENEGMYHKREPSVRVRRQEPGWKSECDCSARVLMKGEEAEAEGKRKRAGRKEKDWRPEREERRGKRERGGRRRGGATAWGKRKGKRGLEK